MSTITTNPDAVIAKCKCNHCDAHIEFERHHAGIKIPCPHCGLETTLYIPAAPKPSTPSRPKIEPAPPASVAAKIKRCYSMRIAAALFFILGAGLLVSGCADNIEAKSAFQQSPAFMEICTGITIMALAAILSGLASVVEAIQNR